MRIPELVLEKLKELPPEKQQAVLEFVESLQQNGAPGKPLNGFEGLLESCNVQITEEDIAEARREMWGQFSPRRELMSAVLDTHTALWSVFDRKRISQTPIGNLKLEIENWKSEVLWRTYSAPRAHCYRSQRLRAGLTYGSPTALESAPV
jgi:hypothetical protein